jgi:hypothetical protein
MLEWRERIYRSDVLIVAELRSKGKKMGKCPEVRELLIHVAARVIFHNSAEGALF